MTAFVLQVVGILFVSTGLFMLAPWMGVTAFGFFTILLGVALELEKRQKHGTGGSDQS